jgi:hypothetical protein
MARYRQRIRALLDVAERSPEAGARLEALAYDLAEELNADLLRLYTLGAAGQLAAVERITVLPALERLRDILRFRGRSPRSLRDVLQKASAELPDSGDGHH